MKKILLVMMMSFSLVMFSACGTKNPQAESSDTQTSLDKNGNTTKKGKISQINGKFFVEEPGKQPAEIQSYSIELEQYVGQTISVTGQYSGDTLFINKVE